MNMKCKKLLPAVVSSLIVAGANFAQAEEMGVTGNVTLTSDYKFRGISQSNESAAIQGGFDFDITKGFYAGVWGSSVDFDVNEGGFDGSLELDYYAGWAGNLGESEVGIDVGYMYYDYPGDNGDKGDYQELYGSLSWQDLTLGMAYSDEYYGGTDTFFYYYADYGFALPADFALSLHLGYNDLDESFFGTGEDSYIDYSLSLSRELFGFEWALAYVGTDLDQEDAWGTDWGEGTTVFSFSKSM
jgi:uncharacterized protein (TIGR02001 family)